MANRRTNALSCWISSNSFTNPFQNSRVLSKTRPQKVSFFVSSEPVHIKNLWTVVTKVFSEFNPVVEIISHVVATERKHCKWISTNVTKFSFGSGSHFRRND